MNKLYLKLAWSNLKNSRQFYLPYVIAGMLSAMMFYTMCAIQGNEGLSKMRGGASVQMVLFFGVIVVGETETGFIPTSVRTSQCLLSSYNVGR